VVYDLKQFWAITSENFWGHSEYKLYNQIVAQCIFFVKAKAQLAIVSEQRSTSFGATNVATQQLLTYCPERLTWCRVQHRASRKMQNATHLAVG